MTDPCCCPSEAGSEVCSLPAKDFERPAHAVKVCPECGKIGKPVQGQTVKALLSVSLREVQDTQYLFCRTQTCPVVYFSMNGEQTFVVDQIREKVYQKDPENEDVFVCYCFRYTIADLRTASLKEWIAIVDDINTGINAGQCACDLRNPQGSCCLGNIRALTTRLEKSTMATT
jgi:hypothetical protein